MSPMDLGFPIRLLLAEQLERTGAAAGGESQTYERVQRSFTGKRQRGEPHTVRHVVSQNPERLKWSKPMADDKLTETDLANQKMGDNDLQGNDQSNVHNQRHAQPDAKKKADDGVVDSLEKMDKDRRAEEELGKGNRSGG
ncbi:hypothetical protein [Pseudohoeflea coraliihabitans]|uniref:Uncharacterized protein n=1 Tax=Pseudohoeflea coraliihabitans TaxID=2860393 RepID=A0ABS6WM82_9HYPH|nr:hypothetical protein [Pseudohoeflea sp. DP4N28-3]MBW3097059.1 hypothetical protein [Pseudohoeflea sp. DP4N28-3]